MNDKLTEFRRKLHREMKDVMGKDVLKGTRWMHLKNPENLNAKRDEQQHLEEALRLNKPLATACYLKEYLHRIWS